MSHNINDYIPGLISVIMGVYNCESTLSAAIESIVSQTYSNWELIMCDDGSTDNTCSVALEYVEKYPNQIILVRNQKNMGLNYTLNRCLEKARGEFVARQDGDDLSLSNRFELQIDALALYPDIALVSCGAYIFSDSETHGERHIKIELPSKKDIIEGNSFIHAASLFRHQVLIDVKGYSVDKRLLRVEDFNLWCKIYAAGYRGLNLSECLYCIREDFALYLRRRFKFRINGVYAKWIGIDMLKLPQHYKLLCIKGIFLGILPKKIYMMLHKKYHKIK